MRLATLVLLLAPPAFAANKAPEAREQTFDVDEDGALNAELRANDDDHDDLTFSLVKAPRNGEATIQPNGKFTYTPKPNWNGKDELVFSVTDGKAKVQRKAIIAVSAVNDPPVPGPAVELRGEEDKPVKGQVTGSDVDGDKLSFTVGDEPATGSVEVDGRTGRFVYTPRDNQTGAVKLTIKLNDTYVDVAVPVTIHLAPVNDAPTASDDSAKGSEDEPLKGKLRASDVDKDALTYSLGDAPKHGKVEIDAQKGTFVYSPAKDWNGDDAFGFLVSDGKATAKARMAIEIVGVNDAPTAFKSDVAGDEDTPLKSKLIAKDPDGDEVYFSVKTDPQHGDVDIDRSSGAFTYTPNENFHGADKFSFEAGDIGGGAVAWVNVVVKPVNDPPRTADSAVNGEEDKPIAGKLKADDVDKEPLTFSLSKSPKHGAVDVKSDGVYRYTPEANFNGEDSFQYEVSDGKAKAAAVVTLRVRPVNDPPVTADVKLSTREEVQARGTVSGTDIDKDRLTFTISKPPKKGEAVVDDKRGAVVYLPRENENGDDEFVVEVSDGNASAEAKVSVTIEPVNDAPVAVTHENKGNEDAPIKGTVVGSDVDKDVLRYAVSGKPRSGTVEIDAASGAYTYTPNANFNGSDEFRFEVADAKARAQGTVKLTVAAVNDAPDVKNVSLSTAEDKPVGGSVPASDIDKDPLTWTLGKPPAKGTAVVDEKTGRITFTPKLNENGDDAFTVLVSDGKAKSEAAVTVALAPVNDAPRADAHENGGKEDEAITGKVTGSDVDKDTLVFTVAARPRSGALELDSSSGAYTYKPNANFNGADAFRFEVSDGKLRDNAEVKLTVEAVNDAPVPRDLVLTGSEDRESAGRIVASDVDKDALTFRLKKVPHKGSVFIDDATGAVRYTPARDQSEKTSFIVEVTDGFAATDATVNVELKAEPDAPIIEPRAIETAEDEAVTVKLAAIDADGDAVTFRVVSQAKLGKADIDADGATLRFTPAADVHGEDELVVEASDGRNRPRATLPVRVAARNDPPTIDPAKAEIVEDSSVEIALAVHDKDGDPVKVALGAKVANADVKLANNLLVITPAKDYAGAIEFDVIPSDPNGKGAPTKVAVTVRNVNDAPTVKDLVLKTAPDRAVSGVVEAHDVDAGDELTFMLAVPPKRGTVTIDDARTGKVTYMPVKDARGEDSFRVRVKDKAGASVSATVRVNIGGAAPVATRGKDPS